MWFSFFISMSQMNITLQNGVYRSIGVPCIFIIIYPSKPLRFATTKLRSQEIKSITIKLIAITIWYALEFCSTAGVACKTIAIEMSPKHPCSFFLSIYYVEIKILQLCGWQCDIEHYDLDCSSAFLSVDPCRCCEGFSTLMIQW